MADETKPQLTKKDRGVVTMSVYCGYKKEGADTRQRYLDMAAKARRSFSDFVRSILDGYKP